jgi:hypothetical protein
MDTRGRKQKKRSFTVEYQRDDFLLLKVDNGIITRIVYASANRRQPHDNGMRSKESTKKRALY